MKNKIILFVFFLLITTFVVLSLCIKTKSTPVPNRDVVTPSTSTPTPAVQISPDTYMSPVLTDYVLLDKKEHTFSFSLKLPKDWIVETSEKSEYTFVFRLTKDHNELNILMPVTYDGAPCNFLYPSLQDNEHGLYYPYFDEINTNFGVVRMARQNLNSYTDTVVFSGCQKSASDLKGNMWDSITKIGIITFSIPKAEYSTVVVKEMESVLKLIKINQIT